MSELSIDVYCGGPFQTNGYLIECDGEGWLFDAPEGVAGWIAEKDLELKGLYLTHQHHDHVIGAGELIKQNGCPVWAFDEPSEELTLAKRLEQMMGMPCQLDPYSVDHLINDLAPLSIGKLTAELLHIPGHSPDSVCFHFAEQQLVIGGDVLFQGGIGRTDFPNGDHAQLITGIKEKLWPLDDTTVVLPGHGGGTTIGEEKMSNPFLQ